MKKNLTNIASVVGAALASLGPICCLPFVFTLIAGLIGVGLSNSLTSTLVALRPIFLTLTVISLIASGYFAYKRPAKCCNSEEQTCQDKSSKTKKVVFWITVAIVSFVLFLPYL